MPVLDAIHMIAYRTKKALQHAGRQSRGKDRKAWMMEQRDAQIAEVCKRAGVPVPPASSWEQSSTAYERQIAKERGWARVS